MALVREAINEETGVGRRPVEAVAAGCDDNEKEAGEEEEREGEDDDNEDEDAESDNNEAPDGG